MEVVSRVWSDTRQRLESPWIGQLAPAIVVGALLGLMVAFAGPLAAVASMAAVFGIVIAFVRPELIILMILGFVSGVIPSSLNPYLRLGGRGIYVSDLLLLLLIGVIIIRRCLEPGFRVRKSPLNWPLLLFLGAVLLGIETAVRGHGTPFSNTTYDARILLYYAIFFAVTSLIRTRQQLMWLLRGLLAVGLAAAAAMIIQALLGRSAGLVNNSAQLLETTSEGQNVIRFYFPGTVAAFVTFMVAVCILTLQSRGWLRTSGIILLLATACGLLLTLNRNLVLSAGSSMLVLLFLERRGSWPRLAGNLALAIAVGSSVLLVLAASGYASRLLDYIPAFSARLSSMFSGTLLSSTETLDWRLKEMGFAWPVIMGNPIFGIGLATAYRPPFFLDDNLQTYIHNAYASLWLKTGLIGLAAFLWLSLSVLWRGFRKWQRVGDPLLRAASLGFTLAFFALLSSNVVAPFFVQDWSVAVLAAMLGINEVIFAVAAIPKPEVPA